MESESETKISVPSCNVCYYNYDHFEKKPLVLIPCCHSFCELCLSQIKLKCPTCNTGIVMKSVNWSLLHIIPDNKSRSPTYTSSDQLLLSYENWSAKGAEFFARKLFKEALQCVEMALSIMPGFEAYYLKGKCLLELKKYQEAVDECEKAITLAPTKPKPHYLQGFALYKMKMFEKALKEFNLVISIVPNEFMPYHLKASCFHQLEKFAEAIEFYDKAIALNPDYFPSINNRNVAVQQNNLKSNALNALSKTTNSPCKSDTNPAMATAGHKMNLRPRKLRNQK